ncbi:hypothetical protein MED297_01915 [Reinekea sp. MED297]|nr:hypothetical protein MED297_01915 [Reinekea sp. MED297] [Reinekea blandensis MED297]
MSAHSSTRMLTVPVQLPCRTHVDEAVKQERYDRFMEVQQR